MAEDPPDNDSANSPPTPRHQRTIDRLDALRGHPINRFGQMLPKELGALSQARSILEHSPVKRFLEHSRLLEQYDRQAGIGNRLGGSVPSSFPRSEIERIADQQRRQRLDLLSSAGLDRTGLLSQTLDALKSSVTLAAHEVYKHHFHLGTITYGLDTNAAKLRNLLSSTKQYLDYLQTLPERVKENLAALAQAGWFLDPEMPVSDAVDFGDELLRATPEEIDAELTVYFRDAAPRIEADLIERRGHREKILKEAFAAHHYGSLYSLSVQGFLTLADGICFDETKKQLFNKGGPRSRVQSLRADTIERIYMELLGSSLPLTEGNERRGKTDQHLNRHAILHGENVDYGTEINSLKAMSFLNFVSHAFDMIADAEDQDFPSSPNDGNGLNLSGLDP